MGEISQVRRKIPKANKPKSSMVMGVVYCGFIFTHGCHGAQYLWITKTLLVRGDITLCLDLIQYASSWGCKFISKGTPMIYKKIDPPLTMTIPKYKVNICNPHQK